MYFTTAAHNGAEWQSQFIDIKIILYNVENLKHKMDWIETKYDQFLTWINIK